MDRWEVVRAAAMDASLPVPMARPTSASAKAARSLMPSCHQPSLSSGGSVGTAGLWIERQDAGQDAGQDVGQDAGQDEGQDAGQDAGQDEGHDEGQDEEAMMKPSDEDPKHSDEHCLMQTWRRNARHMLATTLSAIQVGGQ